MTEKPRCSGGECYCVTCGRLLTDETQIGLQCSTCKPHRATSRGSATQRSLKWHEILEVNYCYKCGGLYSPKDNSISHPHMLDPERGNVWSAVQLSPGNL